MVAITPLRTLTLAMFGLAASSALAQAQTNSVAVVNTGSASGQDVDASSLAAEYHAAGNSTQVPTDIVITSPTSDTVWYDHSNVTVSWTGTRPDRFAFQIINNNASVRQSGLSLRASVNVIEGTVTTQLGLMTEGEYFLRFYDPLDISKRIAISPHFNVKPKSANPALTPNSTGSLGGANATTNASDSTVNGSTRLSNGNVADTTNKTRADTKPATDSATVLHRCTAAAYTAALIVVAVLALV